MQITADKSHAMTLERALTRWIVVRRVGKKPMTRRYHWQVVKAIRRCWRDALPKPVAEISNDDVARFASRAKIYSPTRWNGMLTVLHAVCEPAKQLERRTVAVSDEMPPSQMEFSALLAECDKLAKSLAGLVINFLGHTGMRITEAKALRWSSVFEDRIEAPASTAKNGKPRQIPIFPGLSDALDRLRAVDDGKGFVLPRGSIRTGLAKACKRAGVRHLTHHDFRHMFATRAIEAGIDVPTVARWLGHSDGGALLAKRYFHLLDAHSRIMAERLQILPKPVVVAVPVAPLVPAQHIYVMPSLNFQVVSA